MVIVVTVGLDIAKSVFQVQGVDVVGGAAIRRQLRRAQVFSGLPLVLTPVASRAHSIGSRRIGRY